MRFCRNPSVHHLRGCAYSTTYYSDPAHLRHSVSSCNCSVIKDKHKDNEYRYCYQQELCAHFRTSLRRIVEAEDSGLLLRSIKSHTIKLNMRTRYLIICRACQKYVYHSMKDESPNTMTFVSAKENIIQGLLIPNILEKA